ncbi:hypothetical protein FS749_016712 [Ceratobasidium sp. UAMH 11750]|nr:hypothetical protein FS749_016712 [Ceratobasidium sp. UAMH 11750]
MDADEGLLVLSKTTSASTSVSTSGPGSGSGQTPATTSSKPKGLSQLKNLILKAANNPPGGLKAVQEEVADIAFRIVQRKNSLAEKHYANANASWEICIGALTGPEILADV